MKNIKNLKEKFNLPLRIQNNLNQVPVCILQKLSSFRFRSKSVGKSWPCYLKYHKSTRVNSILCLEHALSAPCEIITLYLFQLVKWNWNATDKSKNSIFRLVHKLKRNWRGILENIYKNLITGTLKLDPFLTQIVMFNIIIWIKLHKNIFVFNFSTTGIV